MASKKARTDPWESGKLGNDERYVQRAGAAEEARVEAARAIHWTFY